MRFRSDNAIDLLRAVDPGSYYDEFAVLIEELLASVNKAENQARREQSKKIVHSYKTSQVAFVEKIILCISLLYGGIFIATACHDCQGSTLGRIAN